MGDQAAYIGPIGAGTQAEVPMLTIALNAALNSLGPFNRAFKAEAGMTPASSADSPRLPPCQSDDFQNQVVVKI